MESPIYSGKPVEHKYNTRSKINKKVINYKELEGDSGDDTDSEDELDPVNFQEFLALKFPSKYQLKSKDFFPNPIQINRWAGWAGPFVKEILVELKEKSFQFI